MSRSDRQAESGVIAAPYPGAFPGTYALILFSSLDRLLSIGRLGQLHLRPGYYVYVGSAFGRGGVRARIAHHARPSRRLHWHIDYLKKVAQLSEIWWTHDPIRREHQWASVVSRLRGATIPLLGFGASDCVCNSHLYFFTKSPSFAAFHKHWQARTRKVSSDSDVTPKEPRRFLWLHSAVPQSTAFRRTLHNPC